MQLLQLALLTAVSCQNQWARRVYYDDNRCANQMTLAVSVFVPGAACSSTVPLNTICEVKSQGPLASSEGTGCENAAQPSDVPFFPSEAIGKPVPRVPYMAINHYPNQDCLLSPTSFEQNLFVADNKCHAVETSKSFFKASCTPESGMIEICSDSACTVCGGANLLNAGTFVTRSGTYSNQCNAGVRMTCTSPSAGPTNSTTPVPSAPLNPKSNSATAHFLTPLIPLALVMFV